MSTYLKAACQCLGVKPAQVMSYQEYPEWGEITLVIDYGIAGGKEYAFPMAELDAILDAKCLDATAGAQRLALAEDIDLGEVEGTGKDGRITVADVRRVSGEET